MDPVVKPVIPAKVRYYRTLEWLELNAKPRRIFLPPPIHRGPIFSNTARMDELAAPRHHYVKYKEPRKVAEAALNYTATSRLCELAAPRQDLRLPKIIPGMPSANVSGRLIELSQPRWPYKKIVPKPLVSVAAMTATASSRVQELAKHKNREDNNLNEFAFKVNPITFAYFASKRTRQMARPHVPWTEQQLMAYWAAQQKRKVAFDAKRASKLAKARQEALDRHKKQYKSMGL